MNFSLRNGESKLCFIDFTCFWKSYDYIHLPASLRIHTIFEGSRLRLRVVEDVHVINAWNVGSDEDD